MLTSFSTVRPGWRVVVRYGSPGPAMRRSGSLIVWSNGSGLSARDLRNLTLQLHRIANTLREAVAEQR